MTLTVYQARQIQDILHDLMFERQSQGKAINYIIDGFNALETHISAINNQYKKGK